MAVWRAFSIAGGSRGRTVSKGRGRTGEMSLRLILTGSRRVRPSATSQCLTQTLGSQEDGLVVSACGEEASSDSQARPVRTEMNERNAHTSGR